MGSFEPIDYIDLAAVIQLARILGGYSVGETYSRNHLDEITVFLAGLYRGEPHEIPLELAVDKRIIKHAQIRNDEKHSRSDKARRFSPVHSYSFK